jgi:hypothetical protein
VEGTDTQLNFEEEEIGFEPVTSKMMLPFKLVQEGGLGTYGFLGGARQCRWYFLLQKTMMIFLWDIFDRTDFS